MKHLDEKDDMISVHKQLYTAKAKTEQCIKNIASLSLEREIEHKNNITNNSTNSLRSKKDLIPKTIFLLAAATVGFVVGKTLF